MLFGVSILMSIISVMGLGQLAYELGRSDRAGFLFRALKLLQREIGVVPLSVLSGFAFFVLFFFLLSRGSILYLEEISRALHEIARGNFGVTVRARSGDELGRLGANILQTAERLKQWMADQKEAERSKNELITSVSHDLRTPLTSVLGYLELIDKDESSDIALLRRNAAIAYHKAQQLKELIDDLFEYTRVSHGALALRLAEIDLKALLAQLAEEFVPALQGAEMEYRLALPEADCRVMADGDLLVRVFQNLLSNAICYGRSGRFVDLEMHRSGRWVVASVINYGAPIAPRDIERIFERFYRIYRSDGARQDQAGNAGLGLAIAKSIVELHHGSIAVRSSDERTVFEVRLSEASAARSQGGIDASIPLAPSSSGESHN